MRSILSRSVPSAGAVCSRAASRAAASRSLLRRTLAFSALLLAAATPAAAFCDQRGGFAVYQCGDRAWFQPPPDGSGAVKAVFWQIGYGNLAIGNGEGMGGTGMGPAGVFSGNDSGLFEVPLVDAAALMRGAGEGGPPDGAICLGPVNWGNAGVDGCCDNRRATDVRSSQDGILNPNFDVRRLTLEGIFEPTDKRAEDYPMAVLLTEETGLHFAVAAVASAARRTEEPDLWRGHFTLADVVEGEANPLTGKRNIIPWQKAPAIRLEPDPPGGPSARGAGSALPAGEGTARQAGSKPPGAGGVWSFTARWDPVFVPGDRSTIPSKAPNMDGPGVGVADMGPLVSYTVERVRLLPGMIGEGGIPRPEVLLWERVVETAENEARIDLASDSCARVVAHLGKQPRAVRIGPISCALGRCGDVGTEIPGPALCVEGPLLAAGKRRS